MRIDSLLFKRDCVTCSAPPPCACSAGQQCIQTSQSCTQCATFTCVDPTTATSSKGVSAGAVAGAVVGILIFVILVALGYLYWRRKQAAKLAAAGPAIDEPKDIPAPADTVLRRPDPQEKPGPVLSPRIRALTEATQRENPVMTTTTGEPYDTATTILDLNSYGQAHGGTSQRSSQIQRGNPFGDDRSIMTTTSAASQGTNVIPIALDAGSRSSQVSSLAPPRAHALNMDHLNVSRDSSVGSSQPAQQTRRLSDNSYMTNASYASDLDAVIITQSQRHVVGAVRADTIPTPLATGSSATGSFAQSQDMLRPGATATRQPARSPLAATSFGPQDVVREAPETEEAEDGQQGDPFHDSHSPSPEPHSPHARLSRATYGTTATFGTNSGSHFDHEPETSDEDGLQTVYTPDISGGARQRPVSNLTQAASVIGAELVGASRVHLGYATPIHTPAMSSSVGGARGKDAYRLTSARLVSPSALSNVSGSSNGSSNPGGHFSREQDRAMAEVQAARAAQLAARESALGSAELEPPRLSNRGSMSTMASGVSVGRADSILEGFPFVPPSPISARPPRSPTSATAQSPSFGQSMAQAQEETLPPPPDRRQLGMSVASEMSNVSTGLGGFAFEIQQQAASSMGHDESEENVRQEQPRRKVGADGRVRASLDTLALTSDLASYPLGFDRNGQRL
ncbi:hypothetical protein PENSPDRAFT_571447 [Peniophora sp. CONT]|nr:hypothetical protein PENSPDRAFT_571447 [Peniophora sp. CONT]